jgi:hypothetical protein
VENFTSGEKVGIDEKITLVKERFECVFTKAVVEALNVNWPIFQNLNIDHDSLEKRI